MPVGLTVSYIDLPADVWGITIAEAVNFLADTEFPEIQGKEFDPGPMPPQEQWGKVMWPNIPREYLDREHLRRHYTIKLGDLINSGTIKRCCNYTKSELPPGHPESREFLTIEELKKAVTILKNDVVVRLGQIKQEPKPRSEGIRPEESWVTRAKEIGVQLFKKFPKLSLEQIADKVHKEMDKRHRSGESGMTGRGGRIPSAGSIKRHALTGIKT